jgi:serine protease inhibitor
MASVTRVNPTAVARGTIQRLNHQTVYKVVLSGGLAAMATDAAAAKVTDALGSFCSIVQTKADGSEIYMVADRHSTNIGSVATFIAKVLDTGTFTVSGGVATLSDAATVTVTEPTDLEGM